MSEQVFEMMAAQLRKPEGETGKQVGVKMNSGNAYINRKAIDELHISDGEKILELGMGNGFFVKEMLAKAKDVIYSGADYSQTMINEASELNKQFLQNGNAEFYLASADKLPFEDKSFDKILGVNIIYFWEKPAIELTEIKRVLKPGGSLVIGIRPKETMQNYPFTRHGFTMYSENELTALLTENGFKINNIYAEREPDQEINGNKIRVDMLVIAAQK